MELSCSNRELTMERTKEKIVLETATVWECEEPDFNAPIKRVGKAALFLDGHTEVFWEEDYATLWNLPRANEEQRNYYRLRHGFLLEGDSVKVVRGRKLPIGMTSKIKGFNIYQVTDSSVRIPYVILEGGKKTRIRNIEPLCGLEEGVKYCNRFAGSLIRGGRV